MALKSRNSYNAPMPPFSMDGVDIEPVRATAKHARRRKYIASPLSKSEQKALHDWEDERSRIIQAQRDRAKEKYLRSKRIRLRQGEMYYYFPDSVLYCPVTTPEPPEAVRHILKKLERKKKGK